LQTDFARRPTCIADHMHEAAKRVQLIPAVCLDVLHFLQMETATFFFFALDRIKNIFWDKAAFRQRFDGFDK